METDKNSFEIFKDIFFETFWFQQPKIFDFILWAADQKKKNKKTFKLLNRILIYL